jgi:hypothetical protein
MDDQTPDDDAAEADRFIDGLVLRGEAAEAVDGELPDGATHEIVVDERGRRAVHRRRFFPA